MTTDRDDASVRRYREASAALDERPSAATRAAILAAAARYVDAKPQAADAPRPASRRRWPLAAAATVLLSTLAVMLATRTEHEMPTFTPPAERAQEQMAVAPSPAAPKVNAEDSAAPTPSSSPPAIASARKPEAGTTDAIRGDHQAGGAPAVRLKKSAPTAAPELKDASPAIAADSATSSVQAARERGATSAEARSAFPAAPAAAPPPPAVARPAPAESPADALGAAGGAGDAAKPDASTANRAARKESAPAPSVQGAVRQEPARDFERSAHDWLERIIKLRSAGRHAEADAEVKRFRERYPDVQVPAAALPPPAAGTR